MEILPILFLFSLSITISLSSIQRHQLLPGFRASQMDYIDNDGVFLLSNNSLFGFGFTTLSPNDISSFLLVLTHLPTSTVIWTANPTSPVSHSDDFLLSLDGNASLSSLWSTNTKHTTAVELHDSGNLVLINSNPPWQSFAYPTDTLLSGQRFVPGMNLISKPNRHNTTQRLTIDSGDMALYVNFRHPQPYWSMKQERRKVDNKIGGTLHSAALVNNSWNFYDQKEVLLWQFIVRDDDTDGNATWAAVLGGDGVISFISLSSGGSSNPSPTKIPQDSCFTPEYCDPYYICYSGIRCQCPAVLASTSNCDPGIASGCDSSSSVQLVKVEDGVGYFATSFVSPIGVSNLSRCKDLCVGNCSCVALFHDESSGNCFVFDQIGSLRQLESDSSGYASYIKISSNGGSSSSDKVRDGGGGGRKELLIILIICFATVAIISVLIVIAVRIRRRRKSPAPSQGSSDEDNFLESIAGMPVRFSYRELQEATDNFAVKLGQGGFGSVYSGKLRDGTHIAVKKLEGIGQGKKEFRSEVTIIGSIHHVHLVRLRGFCAEGAHRLLAYEYMAKGSLDRWIFGDNEEGFHLDWDKRYNIALGTAKGLAYLHEDCSSKIIHCDIKPENVLLDDNFRAKVSDFGLAKLMTREQSHVFTTMRGTRGYLAPEWITNYAISEKSDVYSFGMVFLEIIGGRKNYDPVENSEKAHFPSYAFKKLEEGKLEDIFDAKLRYDDKDGRVDTAIKVALWCIQEDLSLRPSMPKVVQMLEGLSYVPHPPTSSQMGFRLFGNMYKSSSEGTSSGPSECNSDAFLSAVRLSGPR